MRVTRPGSRPSSRSSAEPASSPGPPRPRTTRSLVGGDRLEADRIVWAGGAWLAGLFPELVDLRVTRQDVYFFGAPAGWQAPSIPGWVDFDNGVYGVGDLDGRGFKASPDREGPAVRPGCRRARRLATRRSARRASTSLSAFRRWPERRSSARAPAPTRSPSDTNFLIAPHPEHEHVWLFGGGSGHGFKHGPALAEYVEKLLNGEEEPDPVFALGTRSPGGGLRAPWIER